MNIEYFYYFQEVAKVRSISKAARNYHISQQGLSRAIHKLEIEYGVLLFKRINSVISLTDAGEVFLEKTSDIISAHNRLKEGISLYKPKKVSWEHKISLFVTLNVAYNIWPALYKHLSRVFPDYIYAVQEMMQNRIVKELCMYPKNNAFAIVSAPLTFKNIFAATSLSFVPLMDTKLMARVSKSSVFAKQERISIEDVKAAPLVIHNDPGLVSLLALLTEDAEIEKHIILRVNNQTNIDERLQAHDAIGLANSFSYYYEESNDAKILPLEKDIETPIYLLYNKNIELSQELVETIDEIKSFIAESFPLVADIEGIKSFDFPDQNFEHML